MKPTQGPAFGQLLIHDISSQRFGIFSLFIGIPSLGLLVYGLLSKSYEYALIGLVVLFVALFEIGRLIWRFRSFQKIYENGEAVRMILKGITRTGDEISFGGQYLYHNKVYYFSTTIQKTKRTQSLREDDQIFLVIDRDNPKQGYIQDLYTPDSPEEMRQSIDKALESELLRTPDAEEEVFTKERIREGSQRFIWIGLLGLLLLFGAFMMLYFGYQQRDMKIGWILLAISITLLGVFLFLRQRFIARAGNEIANPPTSAHTPGGCQVEDLGQGLKITFVERHWGYLIWIFVGTIFTLIGISTRGDPADSPFSFLIPLLIGIVIIYAGLVKLINHNEIIVTSNTLRVLSVPLPALVKRPIDSTQVSQLIVNDIDDDDVPQNYQLDIRLRDGRTVLLAKTVNGNTVEFIKQKIEDYLGIQNRAGTDKKKRTGKKQPKD